MSKSEKIAQKGLFRWLEEQGHLLIIPNIKMFGDKNPKGKKWESDLIYLNKANHIVEMEIKASRSDFKADFGKPKHKILDPLFKHSPNYNRKLIPNAFYFALKKGIIKDSSDLSQIPKHYGVLEWDWDSSVKVFDINHIRPSTILHRENFKNPYNYMKMARTLMYHYFNKAYG